MGCRNRLVSLLLIVLSLLLVLLALTFIAQNPQTIQRTLTAISPVFASIDWTIVIAILALLVSLLSLVNDWESTRLNKTMYKDIQTEKEAKQLTITVEETIKDTTETYPDDLWGIRLMVNNRGSETIFFSAIEIELGYRRRYRFVDKLHTILTLLGYEEKLEYKVYYSIAGAGIGRVKFHAKVMEPYPAFTAQDLSGKRMYLVNWETKTAINLESGLERKPYRGPEPGKKEIWVLFGYLPGSRRVDPMNLQDTDFVMNTIKCWIHTDAGIYYVEGGFSQFSYLDSRFRDVLDQVANQLAVEEIQ